MAKAPVLPLPPSEKIQTEHLSDWYTMQGRLKKLKDSEMSLRKAIAGEFFRFQNGTQAFKLPDGAKLKCVYARTYKVDAAVFTSLFDRLRALGLDPNTVVEWKPSLKVSAYNDLNAEQKAVMNECLESDLGSPTLSIEVPKGK